jgi:hypothetical protein
MSLTANQEKAIRDHVLASVDDATKRLIRLANYDLHYGPVTEPDDDEKALRERLPALLDDFRKAVESIGFTY